LAASLQALMHSSTFRQAILAEEPLEIPAGASALERNQTELFNNLRALFEEQWGDDASSSSSPMNFRALLSNLRSLASEGFGETQMEDAHEAMRLILSSASAALENGRGSRRLSELFASRMVTTFTCDTCNASRSHVEQVFDLLIPMDPKSPMMTMMKGFQLYFKSDGILNVDCPSCALRRNHTSITRFESTPDLLLISLKRFTHDGRKIKAYAYNPLQIDLAAMAGAGEGRYRLIAVVHHQGESIHAGHYVTDFLHPEDRKWYHADDSAVTELGRLVNQVGPTQTAFLYERIV
jgi:ubiquitin C-terminal hydrolase